MEKDLLTLTIMELRLFISVEYIFLLRSQNLIMFSGENNETVRLLFITESKDNFSVAMKQSLS